MPSELTPQPEQAIAPAGIDWNAAINAAVEKASAINTKMDIAVVDAGGNLKAFLRMDGAWIGSIDIAVKKAKTARFFDMPRSEEHTSELQSP